MINYYTVELSKHGEMTYKFLSYYEKNCIKPLSRPVFSYNFLFYYFIRENNEFF